MLKQIVVGVDGRECGGDAVALAKLLVAVDAELTLAYVFGGDGHAHRGATAAHEASEGERAAALLETLREQRVSKRTCARVVDLRLWDAACMSFAT